MEKLLVSIADAGQVLSLGRTSIYDLMRSGELETRKMGRRRLITAEVAPAAGRYSRTEGQSDGPDQSAPRQAAPVL